MTDGNPSDPGGPGLVPASLGGLCPRCGARSLFDGVVKFAPRCGNCGLDFSSFNVGDGPAAFLTLFIGTIIVILAIWVQLAAEPPFWVHILLWVPLTTLAVIGGLRFAKGALLVSEYRRGAREARSTSDDSE